MNLGSFIALLLTKLGCF